jgi:predicted amidohydrolase YtcJ
MRIRSTAIVWSLALAALAAQGRAQAAPGAAAPADWIVLDAGVYTVNARQPWARALAIRGDKIIGVGSARQMARYRGPQTKIIDAEGHLVLPGFFDCHIHLLNGALAMHRLDLNGAKNVPEIQQRLRAYAAGHPSGWILGRGWSYEQFGARTLPDKAMLDAVAPNRPILLTSFDGHNSWANSKALELAGITRTTPDPPNGTIVRNPKTGEPTGVLKETAGQLVARIIPEPTNQQKFAALARAIALLSAAGVTAVDSAGFDFQVLPLFARLRQEGRLTVRLYVAHVIRPPELTHADIELLELGRELYHDDWIRTGSAKFFLDGVIETHTAAMLAPYSDRPNTTGTLQWDPANYTQAVSKLNRLGFQVFTHAIGDRAVRVALDAYQESEKANGGDDLRDRVEHIETVSAQDIPRFGQRGVIASMQPLHAYPDKENDVWIRAVGAEREQRAFAWHSIERAGGRLAFGSDWPVVTFNPWPGVQTALTRQTAEGQPVGGWVPEQKITLARAIKAYTLDAAYASRSEQTEGSLEPGKLADLIIVSQNLFRIDAHPIGGTKVLLTMVGGRVVYHAPGWPPAAQTRPKGATR